jgi:hypothetical protein
VSRVPWHLFQDCQLRAHLVVGAIVQADGPAGLNDSTAALAVLKRLARKQKPAGDYAATVVREAGWPQVYFAFNDEADAQQFAAALGAETTASHPGWASQRAFEMAGAKIRELQAFLPPQRVKSDPPDGTSQRIRVRRGPRAPVTRTKRFLGVACSKVGRGILGGMRPITPRRSDAMCGRGDAATEKRPSAAEAQA